jgi:hypothetical protein
MTNCLVKSIILYTILISMILVIKPSHFYFDNNKTKLKSWDLYRDTNNTRDLITFHSSVLLLGLLSFIIGNLV